jgi:Raf kinase inhibitor-like YbhB/YbcL family protein
MHKMLAAFVAAFGGLSATVALAQDMTLTSAEVADGSTIKEAQVANGFGCKGGNISPSLSWSGAPSDTKSSALTVYDPDAPTGSGFWHWVVFNIPASTTSILLGAGDVKKKLMPKGVIQSRTDFGTDGYGGPCPPQGDKPHHYIFTVLCGRRGQAAIRQGPQRVGRSGRLPQQGEGKSHCDVWSLTQQRLFTTRTASALLRMSSARN